MISRDPICPSIDLLPFELYLFVSPLTVFFVFVLVWKCLSSFCLYLHVLSTILFSGIMGVETDSEVIVNVKSSICVNCNEVFSTAVQLKKHEKKCLLGMLIFIN